MKQCKTMNTRSSVVPLTTNNNCNNLPTACTQLNCLKIYYCASFILTASVTEVIFDVLISTFIAHTDRERIQFMFVYFSAPFRSHSR